MTRLRLSSSERERLYRAEAAKAVTEGRGEYPICRLCDLPVTPGQAWDVNHESHKPRWLGGEIDGISHRRCNRDHNNEHDTPLYHKVARVRRKHNGSFRAQSPMRFGRDDAIKQSIDGTPRYRATGKPVFKRTWIKQIERPQR